MFWSLSFFIPTVGEPSYFTPEVFSRLLQDTDLNDPEQREVAAEVLTAYLVDADEVDEDGDEDEEMVGEVAGGSGSSNSTNTTVENDHGEGVSE